MYRIIKITENGFYNIQKKRKFLFFEWWHTLNHGDNNCPIYFGSLKKAEDYLKTDYFVIIKSINQ